MRPIESPVWCESIIVDEAGLAVTSRGRELRLEFSDLDRVSIRTTDDGPGAEDVFWSLSVGSMEYLVPQGSPGEAELFEHLLTLPNFDSQAMIAAMTCSENAEFECWRRPVD